jgi:hypothetical protein
MGEVEQSLSRLGRRWSTAEEDRLFDAVRAGTPIEALVADFGRTKGALNSRVRKMLPTDHPARYQGDAIGGLHLLLTEDPAYQRPMSIREELRQRRNGSRPYRSVSDIDLVTIAEALVEAVEDPARQTAARVLEEVNERRLWPELVERKADKLVWTSESAITRREAVVQARDLLDGVRNNS